MGGGGSLRLWAPFFKKSIDVLYEKSVGSYKKRF